MNLILDDWDYMLIDSCKQHHDNPENRIIALRLIWSKRCAIDVQRVENACIYRRLIEILSFVKDGSFLDFCDKMSFLMRFEKRDVIYSSDIYDYVCSTLAITPVANFHGYAKWIKEQEEKSNEA